MRTTAKLAFTLTTALMMIAGCSSSKSVEGAARTSLAAGTTPATPSPVTVAEATTTTVAAETTLAITTTTAPPPLVLSGDGIGSFILGDEATSVIDGLTARLGAPVRDEPVEYAVADGLGQYSTVDGELGFVSPRGRSVCWSIGFCGEFGGDTTGTMSFMGWSYSEDPTAALQSTSGAMLGMRWSELPSLHAEAGGCYSIGSGGIDGIRLTLQSAGEPFGSFDDAGNYITNVPDPAAVTIISMETGDVPVFLYGDC